ncbi:MAG: hypothetical protein A2Z25_18885 [Planctomycetes bacterium RBG_16_55_9]|nr:MAG: hypothetical protein A2Z25_18885 [Planctomycetes bacterium RBG_16_55_9]
MHLEGDALTPILTLDLHNPQQTQTKELKLRHVIRGLILPQAVQKTANEFKTRNGSLKIEKLAHGLLKPPELELEPSEALKRLQAQLDRLMRATSMEIKSEIHSRLVFGAGCIPMILIGIGLGILKKGGHLLSAFGASCVPAAMLIVCIMSGKQLTENLRAQTLSGIALMWAGLGFLCFLALVIYSRLLRH